MPGSRTARTLYWLAVALATTSALANGPVEVHLLRPDSLDGWDYGPSPVSGWTIAEGRLTGSAQATPLVSGFSFGDFRLDLQWSASGGGVLTIALPDVPAGKGLQLALREGDGCGRLADGDKMLAPGAKIEPVGKEKMHTATVDRKGGKLAVSIDGRRLYEVDVKPERRFGLGLAVEGGAVTLSDLRAQEPLGEPIFNGNDLAGWWCPGNLAAWKAEKGELVLHQAGGNYIRTQKEFGNFTLSLEYLIIERGNSGIGIRTAHDGWPSSEGMELQIEDRPALDKHATMAVYGNVPPIARADKSATWNRVVVKADGWMISAWVNGQLVQQINTARHPELKHRHLKGWIGFQDHGGWVRFRNIRAFEAPDGPGPAAWYVPQPPQAATTLLDRLMNPGRLSIDDGIRSGVATNVVVGLPTVPPPRPQVSGPAGDPRSGDRRGQETRTERKEQQEKSKTEHVLAELTGPGAVVRIARTGDEGRLAFYFDGQPKPRLECKPADLWRAVPPVGEDPNPVVTCLTYSKSLKIVLCDAKQGSYRIDYVTLPAAMQVESFADPHSGFPRGWLSSVEYRLGQSRWGVIRQHDPMARFASEKKTIEPGKTERLVHVDGAGIVQWLQLQGGAQVLGNDDLWLEVTVDGEPTPAIAAPARFLFAGLAAGGNFGNFVLVQRDGWFNRLAMPFGRGITVAARNAGQKPVPGVGVTLCVQPATDKEIAGRMRLRGVFRPACEGSDELIHLDGAARLVGLVYQQPDGPPTGICSLAIDGRPVPGWQATNLDPFLGQAGDFRACLSGRQGPLSWRYLLLAPVDCQKSLVLKAAACKLGDRLALYYAKK